MTQAQHTKGKWVYDNYLIICGNKIIADTIPHEEEFSEKEAEANGKIMAAAPDLLAALKAAMANLRHHSGNNADFDEVFANELAVIAKAEGK